MATQHFVIIGNSAGGLTALERIRKSDRESKITLISAEKGPAYGKVLTPYLASGERTDISIRTADYYKKMDVETMFETRVTEVTADSVTTQAGKRIPFDKCLIATGANPLVPPIAHLDAEGVFHLTEIAHSYAILDWLQKKKCKHAICVGGGLIGMQASKALRKAGLDVTMVELLDRVLPGSLDDEASDLIKAELARNGVRVITGEAVDEIVNGKGKEAKGIKLKSGTVLEGDMVIVGTGVTPNTDFVDTKAIECDNGILVDSQLRTSSSNVFAAGDCARAPDFFNPSNKVVHATWFTAVDHGMIAGANMVGEEMDFQGSLGMNVDPIFNTTLAQIGLSEPDSDECQVHVTQGKGSYRKIIVKNNRLAGVLIVGSVDDTGVLNQLIRNQTELSEQEIESLAHKVSYNSVLVGHGGYLHYNQP